MKCGNCSEEEFLSVVGSFLSGFSCFVRNVREPPGNQTMPVLLGEQIFLVLFESEGPFNVKSSGFILF